MSIGMLFMVLGVAAAAWVIIDVLVNQRRMDVVEKVIWIVCALLFSIFTAIVYFAVKKS